MDVGNRKKALRVRLRNVLNHTNCVECGCPHLTKRSHAKFCSIECRWNHGNRSRSGGFWTLRYSSKVQPEVDRIMGVAAKLSPRQRGRFADWLLRNGHRALTHHEVDYFVADFNTQGI